jgi:uncharacterized protein (TIGR02594 family)
MADNDNNLVFTVSSDMGAASRGLDKFNSDVTSATDKISKKFTALGGAIDKGISSSLQQRINSMVGIGTSAAKEWNGALADQGKALDALRAKYSPLFSTIKQYQSAVSDIRTLYKSGAIGADEYTAALSRQRQAALASIAVIKGAPQGKKPTAQNDNEKVAGSNSFVFRNIAQQVNQVAQQGVATGNYLQALAIQVPDILGAFGSIPAVLAGGAIAVGASLLSMESDTKKLDQALKDNADTLDLLKEKYGELTKVTATNVAGGSFVLADARNQKTSIDAVLRNQLGGFVGDINDTRVGSSVYGTNSLKALGNLQSLNGDQKQFAAPVSALLESVKNGHTDLETFNKDVEDLYNNLVKSSDNPQALRATADAVEEIADAAFSSSGKFKPFQDAINLLKVQGIDGLSKFVDQVHKIGEEQGIGKLADELIAKGKDIVQLTQNVEKLNRELQAIDREDTRPGLADRNALTGYVARRAKDLANVNAQFAAEQQTASARTFAERIAAAAASSRAQHPANADEGGGADARAARAVQAEANRQQIELRDAAKSRSDSLNQAIESQQQEIALIGKTAGEQAALRKEYELTSQIRLEAAKDGIPADEAEIARIQQKTAELGRLADAAAKAKLSQDLADHNRLAALPSQERQVATTLQQYGIDNKDLNSPQANQIRQSLQMDDNRQAITGFMTDFKDGLVKNGDSIGKAFGTAISNALMKEADKLWDNLFNQIANVILGTGTSGAATGGGGGIATAGVGVVGKILGGGSSGGGSSSGTSAGAVTSTGSAVDKAMSLFGANENTNNGQINSFLKQGGVDINAAQTAWCAAFVNSSLAQVGVKGTGSLTANSFLNWGTKIDPSKVLKGDVLVEDRGLGATDAGGHVGFATGSTRMFGGQQQVQMLSGNSADSVQTTWVNAMSVQARRATDSANALGKVASSANSTTQGLGQLGQQLGGAGAFPAAPSAGIGGLFSRLFGGGLTSYGSSVAAASPQFAGALASGGVGLFADGGYTGPGGKNTPAGIVHAGEFVVPKHIVDKIGVPALSTMMKGYANGGLVTPALVSAPRAPALRPTMAATGDRGGQPGVLQVHINGANGDDHVRELVKQGVGEGLGQYNQQQQRGGFGTLQSRFNAQKG